MQCPRCSPLLVVLAVACSGSESPSVGRLQVAMAMGNEHDVTHVDFRVLPAGSCAGVAVAQTVVPLEMERLGADLGAGAGHPFADGLMVVAPGTYQACAAPLQSDGSPSAACAVASATVSVSVGLTTEIVLVSQCVGAGNGGVDIVAALNDPPLIEDVDVTPSKFIKVCESASLAITATDVDGDPLVYSWAITSRPAGSAPVLVGTASVASFDADLEGTYEVTATVTDAHGATASIALPMHVQDLPCSGEALWLYGAGGAGGAEIPTTIAVDALGNSYVGGSFDSPTVDFGAGVHVNSGSTFNDAFVASLDPDGTPRWSRTYGNQTESGIFQVMVSPSQTEVIIVGFFRAVMNSGLGCPTNHTSVGLGDVLVASLDAATGACNWSVAYGGTGFDFPFAAAVDSMGDVVIGGRSGSPSFLGYPRAAGPMFYAKLRGTDGGLVWARRTGGAATGQVNAIAIDDADQIAITGESAGPTVTFEGVGGVTITTPTHPMGLLFVGLLDPAGDMRVNRLATSESIGTRGVGPFSVAFDSTRRVAIAGSYDGPFDFGAPYPAPAPGEYGTFVSVFDDQLSHLWTVAGALDSQISSVVFDAHDDLRIAGATAATIDFGGGPRQGAFVGTLSGGDGSELWMVSGLDDGSPYATLPLDIALDAADVAYVTGWYGPAAGSPFTIGGAPPLASNGFSDIWVAKLAP